MRQASKYFIPAALAIITLAGCRNDLNEPEITTGKDCPSFTATIGHTRAFDQSWEKGDQIGISGSGHTNVCHHTSAGDGSFTVKKSGDEIYFQDDSEVDFSAYYPWANMAEGATSIKTDTRNQAQQKNFDFLWAKASGKKEAPNVTFTFAHMMTKISFTIKSGTGLSYDELKATTLSLQGFRHTGSFNITDGSTTVDAATGTLTFSGFATFNDAEKTAKFSLILFPQIFSKPLDFLAELALPYDNSLSLKAAIDFTSANREKDGANAKNEWVAGRQYNLSVTLNKTHITLNGCEIKPWNEVSGDDITLE
ncbi:MAG: fimbrillin family protein [Muribaculaceae bacterium]|nr:fimbrillin family protein [Muribaculaceae bacterium]